MKTLRLASLFLLTSLLAVSAQPGGGGPGEMDLTLMKLFGNHKAFSAKADMTVTGKTQQGPMTMIADVAMLDGKMRTEVDMANMKGGSLTAASMAQMKQMGMDKVVNITLPAQKKMLVIFPGMKSYAAMALPESVAGSLTNQTNLKTTELGKETIDGHPCVKNKVVVTEAGKTTEFTVWNATDLKEFPIQFESTDSGTSIRGKYREVQFTKPDARLFEPPAGFKGYTDMQDMMMSVMSKMMPPPQGR